MPSTRSLFHCIGPSNALNIKLVERSFMYIQVISLICRLYIVKQRLLLHSKFLLSALRQEV